MVKGTGPTGLVACGHPNLCTFSLYFDNFPHYENHHPKIISRKIASPVRGSHMRLFSQKWGETSSKCGLVSILLVKVAAQAAADASSGQQCGTALAIVAGSCHPAQPRDTEPPKILRIVYACVGLSEWILLFTTKVLICICLLIYVFFFINLTSNFRNSENKIFSPIKLAKILLVILILNSNNFCFSFTQLAGR